MSFLAQLKQLKDLDLNAKTLLIREDLNAPISDGNVTSDARLRAAIPTIELALKAGANIILTSHLGRPTEGVFEEQYSLKPVAQHLGRLLSLDIAVIDNWQQQSIIFDDKSNNHNPVVMLENVRFNQGEKANDTNLANAYAELADIVVMDAFGTAHRAQASTEAVIRAAQQHPNKQACAGPLLYSELEALSAAIEAPKQPLVAIVGGSKVSTKLDVLNQLSQIADQLIVGGGIANTFLAAAGYSVGKSLYESDLIDTAKQLLASGKLPLPTDVVVASDFAKDAPATIKNISDVNDTDMILDIGPDSATANHHIIANAGTVLWNGPLGVFEFPAFAQGTKQLAVSIANSSAFSVAGGGDTLAAIDAFGIADQISYISTGGGAFLEFIEGKTLPAVAALINS